MSDGPRDQESDPQDTADEPTTGPPAGAAAASSLGAGTPSGPASAGPGSVSAQQSRPDAAGRKRTARPAEPADEVKKRRKRRLIMAGIAVAAALVVIAICAGGLAVLRVFRVDAADDRDDQRLRNNACLELETRLNRLVPPGATTTGPQRRAIAVRDENSATRIYVGQLDNQRVSDGWRELLDARTAYAEALDAQVKSRTPAFYVAPAPRDGISLAEQVTRWSPDACAGPIRRLAAPDL